MGRGWQILTPVLCNDMDFQTKGKRQIFNIVCCAQLSKINQFCVVHKKSKNFQTVSNLQTFFFHPCPRFELSNGLGHVFLSVKGSKFPNLVSQRGLIWLLNTFRVHRCLFLSTSILIDFYYSIFHDWFFMWKFLLLSDRYLDLQVSAARIVIVFC